MHRPLPCPIAIDGPAGSGKSTVGAALCAHFGYTFLDTGLMYRAVALAALRRRIPADDAARASELAATLEMTIECTDDTRIFFGNEDVTTELKSSPVDNAVSAYSQYAGVREPLVARQRTIASLAPTVVAGRDIGTVVFPDAPLKFFLDASQHARAFRRSQQAHQSATIAEQNIAARDKQDSNRTVSPLKRADDAIFLDTTNLGLDAVVSFVLEHVRCAID